MAFARFNLYVNSYSFLFKGAWVTKGPRGRRWAWRLEILGLVFFWTWYGSILYGCGSWGKALAYLLVSHVVTSPLHVQVRSSIPTVTTTDQDGQIVLSHFSMSTADLGPTESFPHRQLRTTTDVICSPSVAFIHGGLHLQVTHHLFPRLPRHNLKRASVLVKEYAQEQGLVYAEFGFVDGNAEVIGVLKDVADQVRLIGKVANVEAKEAIEKKLANGRD
jgi:delta8-fatty-acid desaturase